MTSFTLNGKAVTVDIDDDTPLLWAIREEAGLTGTKFGCGIGMCGACTVHVGGRATRSCITPVSAVEGVDVTTIEGLDPAAQHPVQKAWRAIQVPQCGYCQSGQVMAATALLKQTPHAGEAEIEAAMTNLCRCGTYNAIRAALHDIAGTGAQA